MTKLYVERRSSGSITVGKCTHRIKDHVIEACDRCERTMRGWGFTDPPATPKPRSSFVRTTVLGVPEKEAKKDDEDEEGEDEA